MNDKPNKHDPTSVLFIPINKDTVHGETSLQ